MDRGVKYANRPSRAEAVQRPWPGITSPDGRPDCELCSWAWRGGRMEVKYLNAMCPKPSHRRLEAA